jgi:MobA/MobL family
MAIYHLNAKVISRGKGKSATAAAAYRAAEKIYDERTGLTFDYSRKIGVYATEIIAPDHAPNWVCDRARLWNEVELFENRKNSRLAREFDIALPGELTHDQKQELVRNFVREQLVSQGMIADVAFHDLESHNPHVHIMLTTRKINEQGFSEKERSWDSRDFLVGIRESWSNYANQALEQAGVIERIDHRTLEEQGINRIPQIHLGPDVAAMMDKGIPTERGEEYLSISSANQEIEALERQLAATEKAIAISEPQPSIQTTQTTTDRQFNSELGLTEESATELSDERVEREREAARTDIVERLQGITDRLGASSLRAEELGEKLRGIGRESNNLIGDNTDNNREAEDPTSSNTEPNRAAEDLAREFQRLEERVRSSDRKTRKNRKSVGESFRELTAQFVEKIQQFTRNIEGDSEDDLTRQTQGFELDRGIDSRQTDRTDQGDLGYPTVHEPNNLGTHSVESSQQRSVAGHQRQSQQQRDSLRPNREKIKLVEPSPQPLNSDEVNQIFNTAIDALRRYGSEWNNKTTFNNSTYQIQEFSVQETYGYQSYLTIDALDGRGRLLTLKGQNFHPKNLIVQENRLSKLDVKQFEPIQTALDYFQQIRQFKQDALELLRFLGERDPQSPFSGYGTLNGKKYQIISDKEAFRVLANDGRGEIFNGPNDSRVRHPEFQAEVHLTDSDLEFFSEAVSKIEQYLQQSRSEQLEHQRKRQQGKGFSR